MREAIGGTWLFQIAIVFIILFAGYLALSINYSKAFKVKNELLSIVERQEGYTEKAADEINVYLTQVNHTIPGVCRAEDGRGYGGTDAYGTGSGKSIYCVKKTTTTNKILNRAYYKITVFFKLDLPIFGDLFTFRISGETSQMYDGQN